MARRSSQSSARLNSLPADETVAIVADRLKGDFQHYAIWVVADAMASSDKPFPSQAVARLGQLASKAEFDRPSKKIHVFHAHRRVQRGSAITKARTRQRANLTRSTTCRTFGRLRREST